MVWRGSSKYIIDTTVELRHVGGAEAKVTGHLQIRLEITARRQELAASAAKEARALVDENIHPPAQDLTDGVERVAGAAKSDLASALKPLVEKLGFVVAAVDKAAKVRRHLCDIQ